MDGERGKPARVQALAGPSRLPCAGWEDQQTLTWRLCRSPLLPDVMVITKCRIA
jgi:hypothetical protein